MTTIFKIAVFVNKMSWTRAAFRLNMDLLRLFWQFLSSVLYDCVETQFHSSVVLYSSKLQYASGYHYLCISDLQGSISLSRHQDLPPTCRFLLPQSHLRSGDATSCHCKAHSTVLDTALRNLHKSDLGSRERNTSKSVSNLIR